MHTTSMPSRDAHLPSAEPHVRAPELLLFNACHQPWAVDTATMIGRVGSGKARTSTFASYFALEM